MKPCISLEHQFSAQTYLPLPVVLVRGEGVHLYDDEGKQYIDMMSAYSAVSQGHCHPRLVKVVQQQAAMLTIVSRAFYTDNLGTFLKNVCELTGYERGLPMNSGAEGVETAIKTVRRWAYKVKGVEEGKAEIITCNNNFHGRTTTIISFTTESSYQDGFAPFTPGFKNIPFGDIDALEKAITPNTAAFLIEPIQGEAGIIIPPNDYLKAAHELCKKHNVLLICDEIQTGLGRTGKILASHHDDVQPDGVILGKALGGGMYPVSIFLSRAEVLDVMIPGTHGSTFGGNPMAAAIANEALNIIKDEKLVERSAELGQYLLEQLHQIDSPLIKDLRGRGLFIALEINPEIMPARDVCMKLLDKGILSKETHGTVVRLAPPLVITKEQLDTVIGAIKDTLMELAASTTE